LTGSENIPNPEVKNPQTGSKILITGSENFKTGSENSQTGSGVFWSKMIG